MGNFSRPFSSQFDDDLNLKKPEGSPVPKVESGPDVVEFYSKKDCSSCKRAKAFLDRKRVRYRQIDIIENPPPRSFLEKWVSAKEIKKYLNPRSDTYKLKNLQERTPTKTEAIRLMVKDPNLIKRPLIKFGNQVAFGFDSDRITDMFKE